MPPALATLASRRKSTSVAGDLTRDEDCRRVAAAAAALGRVTGLLNCTGLEIHGTVVNMPEADWDRVIAANLKTIFLLSKHVIPHMIAGGGGSVVNMSSVQAIATQRDVAAYTATKGAVISLTRVMAVDHGAQNIRVTAICPGTIETPLARAVAEMYSPGDPAKAIRQSGAPNTPSIASANRSKWRGWPLFFCRKMRVSSQARTTSSTAVFALL